MPNILIVEDEVSMNNIIYDYLNNLGYNIDQAFDGIEALSKIEANKPDLIVLDIMLPLKNGYEVLEEIRKNNDTLVILLTALDTEVNKLKGFNLGADDYVTKPFSPRVLVAKINAMLKRNNLSIENKVEINDLVIDKAERKVCKDDEVIEFTKTEFDLLVFLVENPNKVLDRDKILSKVWGYDYFGETRVVDTNIKNIRKKLSTNSNIKTVVGVGYKYVRED